MAEPAGAIPPDPDPAPPAPRRAAPRAASVGLALAGLAVLAAFFLPALFPDRQLAYFDDGRLHVPMKRWIAESLRAGHLPQWNPYAGLGAPVVAGGVDAALHPFNLLLRALPFDLAYALWVLLCYPLAAGGAALLARRLGLPRSGAFLAGLGFALSGYTVSLSGNVQFLGALALFPWILAAAHAWTEAPSPGSGALLAAASFTCIASGDPQGWAIAVALVPLLALALAPPAERWRRAVRAAAAVGLAVLAAAPALLPVVAWIPASNRGEPLSASDYRLFDLLPWRALELVLPHLGRTSGRFLASDLYERLANDGVSSFPWALSEYAGLTVVTLALLGAVRHRAARALALAAAAFLWMAMGSRGGFGDLARHLPVLSGLRFWEKLCAWPALLLAVAAGFGLRALVDVPGDARRLRTALLAAAAAALAGAGLVAGVPALPAALAPAGASPAALAELGSNLLDSFVHAAAFAAALGGAAHLATLGRARLAVPLAVAVCVLDLAAANVRAYVLYAPEASHAPSPLAGYLHAHPGPARLVAPFGLYGQDRHQVVMEEAWVLGSAHLGAAWNVPWHVGNLENYSGMRPVRSNRFWRRLGGLEQLPGFGLWGFGWVWAPPEITARALQRLPPGAERVPDAPAAMAGTLYRIPSRPRAYLAGALAQVDRRGAMEFALDPASAASGRSVVEGPVPADYRPPAGAARLALDEPERVEVQTRADGPALLVLNDEFAPGWTAEVDGARTEILPANYLARGVWLPPGAHLVRFTYRTPLLAEGSAVGLALLAALAGWALVRARRPRGGGAPVEPSPLRLEAAGAAAAAPEGLQRLAARARAAWRRVPPWARVAALYVLVLALFFAPAVMGLGGFAYRDDGRMHGPHKRFVAEQLAHGHLPEWNPYGGLGFPLVAGGVDAVQHPFNLLLVLLPFHAAFTCWVLLSALLAALGAYLWARTLGLGPAAATAAGLALALGGYLVSSTDNVQYLTALASVPLFLALSQRFVERRTPGAAALLALGAWTAAAAGDPQSFGLALLLAPLQAALFTDGLRPRARLGRAALAAGIAALAAAPILLPMAAWIPHSSRGDPLVWIERLRYGMLPLRLLELGVPGLLGLEARPAPQALYQAYASDPYTPMPWVMSEYAGVVVIALAVLGAARGRRAAALLGGAALFAWAALGRAAGFDQLAEHLPVVAGFRYWEKVAFFTALLLAGAAAFGVEAWLREPERLRRTARVAGAGAGLLALVVLAGWVAPRLVLGVVGRPGHPDESAELAANLTAGALHAALALLALSALAARSARGRLAGPRLAAALVSLVAIDLATANLSAYVLVAPPYLAPHSAFGEQLAAEPGQHRVTSPFPVPRFGPGPVQPFEWEMIHGSALLYSGWNVDGRVGNFEPYTGMVPARAMRFQLRTGYKHQLPQLGMWGVDHVVVPMDGPPPGEYDLRPPLDVAATDLEHRAWLARLPHRPRAYLADEVVAVDRRGAMEFVLDPAAVTSRRTVVEGLAPPPGSGPAGEARLVADAPEAIDVEVSAAREALLVLNDTFAPGWTAAVDGVAAPIAPANYLARGVRVPAGTHRVSFRYATPLLGAGWAVAALLATALGAWALLARRRRR